MRFRSWARGVGRDSAAVVAGFVVALAVTAPAGAAEGWVPVDCQDRAVEVEVMRQRARAVEEERLRRRGGATEEEPRPWEVVPHPDPVTPREVVEDFLHGYFELFFRDRIPSDAEERIVHWGLRRGRMRFEVERVETWTPERCRHPEPRPFHYLVRLFEPGGGEVARATVGPSGRVGMLGHGRPLGGPLPLPRDVPRLLRERFGLSMEVEQAQLVTLWGLPSHCPDSAPCIAFRSGGRTYLLEAGRFGDALYEVPDDSRRLSVLAWNWRRAARGFPLCDVDPERPLVSIGYGWAEARQVAVAGREDGRGGRVDQ